MTAKTVSARVAELRARRQSAGLVRMELYAHPDDLQKIKDTVVKLHIRRQKSGCVK